MEIINHFCLLQIYDCSSYQDAINLISNKKFRETFYACPNAIGIFIQYNEHFALLSNFHLNEMEAKYFNEKPILISFQSKIDQKFFIRWRMRGKQKMLILEVEESHETNLDVVKDFTMDFLLTSIKNGQSGMF
jgi:hypothetical protein